MSSAPRPRRATRSSRSASGRRSRRSSRRRRSSARSSSPSPMPAGAPRSPPRLPFARGRRRPGRSRRAGRRRGQRCRRLRRPAGHGRDADAPASDSALANKESLIAAGPVVQPLRATPGAELIPVDSEHCAVHQCLRSSIDAGREVPDRAHGQRRAVPRARRRATLARCRVDEALAHPTWAMGPKITVDSSTLMNKGLEVIEAHELFGIAVRPDRGRRPPAVGRALDGRVHRRLDDRPAQHARHAAADRLRAGAIRSRIATPFGRIDWAQLGRLDFEPPDTATFRCLAAGLRGRPDRAARAPAWLSAANEVAVEAFLAGRISLESDRRRVRCSPRRA